MSKIIKTIIILAGVLILLVVLAASIGAAGVSIGETVSIIGSYIPGVSNLIDQADLDPKSLVVISQIRLPRIFMALVVGIALASAGVIFQGLFRNPMADPFVIGVSAGGAFGAAVALFFSSSFILLNISITTVFALIGALGTTFLVYSIASSRGRV